MSDSKPPYPSAYPAAPPPYPDGQAVPAGSGPAYATNYGQPPMNYGAPPAMGPPQGQIIVNPATVTLQTGQAGNCPNCHVGVLSEDFQVGCLVLIIIGVILFFPIGLLYLLCLGDARSYKCLNCGYIRA